MASQYSDLIQQAFEDLAVVQPGETISSALQANGFAELLQMLQSFSTEGATVFTEQTASFPLNVGVSAYTLGVGGSLATSVRAQRVVAWRATSGAFACGGSPLPYDSFDAAVSSAGQKFQSVVGQVQALLAPYYLSPSLLLSNAAVPMFLAADASWPLINIRVFPVPFGGTLDLTFWSPITAPASVSDTVTLPPGFEDMIHYNLAVRLYPKYSRVGGMSPELAANAQNTKASVVAQNSPIQTQPPQPQPQSQIGPAA